MKGFVLTILILMSIMFISGCSKKADFSNFYHEGKSYIRPHHNSDTIW